MMILTAVFLLLTEHADKSLANLALRDLDVVLGVTAIRHEGKEAIFGNVELKINRSVWIHQVPLTIHVADYLQAGIPCGRRWGRPCCGWKETNLQTSCQ